jgi:hypothetical protein
VPHFVFVSQTALSVFASDHGTRGLPLEYGMLPDALPERIMQDHFGIELHSIDAAR